MRLYRTKKQGQTMMEYIIIIALIAAASIPVVSILGNVFRDRVQNAADAMINNEGGYQSRGSEFVKQGQNRVKKNMGDFYRP